MREVLILGSKDNPLYTFYCKCKKGTGFPIVIKCGKNEWNTNKISFINMNADISFNNSPPVIASRGATTVLIFNTPTSVTRHKDGSYTFKGI